MYQLAAIDCHVFVYCGKLSIKSIHTDRLPHIIVLSNYVIMFLNRKAYGLLYNNAKCIFYVDFSGFLSHTIDLGVNILLAPFLKNGWIPTHCWVLILNWIYTCTDVA